jgi:hypothetical protein
MFRSTFNENPSESYQPSAAIPPSVIRALIAELSL